MNILEIIIVELLNSSSIAKRKHMTRLTSSVRECERSLCGRCQLPGMVTLPWTSANPVKFSEVSHTLCLNNDLGRAVL